MLILAGVAIATLTGDNGILTKAIDAKTSTEIGEEKEKIELSTVGALSKDNGGKIKRNYLNDELTNYIGTEGTDYSLSGSETAPFVVKYLDSGRSYVIDEDGNVSEYVDVAEYVKVGDYVNYNPTVSDKNGTPVEANKLTYMSPIGTIPTNSGEPITHGNGNSDQTFTATADMKWKVLSIKNGKVELISEDKTKAFLIKGAVGYLYAEQELHEICKIYGYGYGADTSQVTKYSYGGPLDGDLIGEITGSGARSITVQDINNITGITEENLKLMNDKYGTLVSNSRGWYPTLYSTNTDKPGKSEKQRYDFEHKYTAYFYDTKDFLLNEYQLLFNGIFWLASRGIEASSAAYYSIFYIKGKTISYTPLCTNDYDFYIYSNPQATDRGIKPIVTLKSDLIDIDAGYNETTGWSLK